MMRHESLNHHHHRYHRRTHPQQRFISIPSSVLRIYRGGDNNLNDDNPPIESSSRHGGTGNILLSTVSGPLFSSFDIVLMGFKSSKMSSVRSMEFYKMPHMTSMCSNKQVLHCTYISSMSTLFTKLTYFPPKLRGTVCRNYKTSQLILFAYSQFVEVSAYPLIYSTYSFVLYNVMNLVSKFIPTRIGFSKDSVIQRAIFDSFQTSITIHLHTFSFRAIK